MLKLTRLATVLALCCAAAPLASAQKGFLISYRASSAVDDLDDRLVIMPNGMATATAVQKGQLLSEADQISSEQVTRLVDLFNQALIEDLYDDPAGAQAVSYDLQLCQNNTLYKLHTSQPQGAVKTLVRKLERLHRAMLSAAAAEDQGAPSQGLNQMSFEASVPGPVGMGLQGMTLSKDGDLQFWREDSMGQRQLLDRVQLDAQAAADLKDLFGVWPSGQSKAAFQADSLLSQGPVTVTIDNKDQFRSLRSSLWQLRAFAQLMPVWKTRN